MYSMYENGVNENFTLFAATQSKHLVLVCDGKNLMECLSFF